MKKLALTYILVSFWPYLTKAQVVQQNDTLYLNYFIATGELGGINEGLMMFYCGNELKAKSVRYNSSSYGILLNVDTIVNFYRKNIGDYTVIKPEWVLRKEQCDYITKVLNDIKTKFIEENVFSNASEHYAILTKKEGYVFIDKTGNWNKFLEIKKFLDIEQKSRNFERRKHPSQTKRRTVP